MAIGNPRCKPWGCERSRPLPPLPTIDDARAAWGFRRRKSPKPRKERVVRDARMDALDAEMLGKDHGVDGILRCIERAGTLQGRAAFLFECNICHRRVKRRADQRRNFRACCGSCPAWQHWLRTKKRKREQDEAAVAA